MSSLGANNTKFDNVVHMMLCQKVERLCPNMVGTGICQIGAGNACEQPVGQPKLTITASLNMTPATVQCSCQLSPARDPRRSGLRLQLGHDFLQRRIKPQNSTGHPRT